MTFNKRKMKKVPSAYPGTHSYIYRNYSIIYSLDRTPGCEPSRVVSVVSHGIPCVPPADYDISGILEFFSFDSNKPVGQYRIPHPNEIGMSDSYYFTQAV